MDDNINDIKRFEKLVKEESNREYVLRLYIAGLTPRSEKSIQQVKQVCEKYLKNRYSLEIIDIYQMPQLASGEQIIAVSTLLKKKRIMDKLTQLQQENSVLKSKLEELQDTLDAIRSGEVDTLLIDTDKGKQLYSLSSEETSYRNVLEQLEKGIAICNEQGTIIYCNAYMKELFHSAKNDIVGSTIVQLFKNNTKLAQDAGEMLRKSSHKFTFETEAYNKKLRVRVAPVNLQVIGEPTEEFKGASYCTIIISDVSEYRNLLNEYEQLNKSLETKVDQRTQELAQQNEEYQTINEELKAAHQELEVAYANLTVNEIKYKTLFESLPIGVTVSDNKGAIIESNELSEELLGLSVTEQTQRKIDGKEWKIIKPDGEPFQNNEYPSVVALNNNILVENVIMGIVKDNDLVTWINVSAKPIPLNKYGVLITYSDITARIKAETDIKNQRDFIQMLLDNSPIPKSNLYKR